MVVVVLKQSGKSGTELHIETIAGEGRKGKGGLPPSAVQEVVPAV
jgi:hypothetical protein